MTRFDLTPLFRTGIGFDHMAKLLEQMGTETPSYPPYNIEKLDDNHYRIVMAVAGFSHDDLDITLEKNVLSITAKPRKETSDDPQDKKHVYLHHGIAERNFIRHFNLADHINVTDANLKNGLLAVTLEQKIPEEMKPRNIQISGGEKHEKQLNLQKA